MHTIATVRTNPTQIFSTPVGRPRHPERDLALQRQQPQRLCLRYSFIFTKQVFTGRSDPSRCPDQISVSISYRLLQKHLPVSKFGPEIEIYRNKPSDLTSNIDNSQGFAESSWPHLLWNRSGMLIAFSEFSSSFSLAWSASSSFPEGTKRQACANLSLYLKHNHPHDRHSISRVPRQSPITCWGFSRRHASYPDSKFCCNANADQSNP
jgi:hypothetical protein